jgi:hypothetical protein
VTVVTYAPGIFPIECVARYVAELVNPNEPAKFSPRQEKLLIVRKKLLTVSNFLLTVKESA